MNCLSKKPSLNRIFAVLLIVCFGVFVFASPVWAGEGDWLGVKTGLMIVYGGLLNGIKHCLGQIFNLVSWLILGLLSAQKFTTMPIVQDGWTIVRNFTNMFFVLGLLAIAFATILRLEAYGYKKLLAKLIIAALLINFSLVLVAPLIDFAQLLTKHFIDEIGYDEFTVKLAGALRVSKIDTTMKDKSLFTKVEYKYEDCVNKILEEGDGKINCRTGEDKNHIRCLECRAARQDDLTAAYIEDEKNSRELDKSDFSSWRVLMALLMSNIYLAIAIFCLGLFAFFLIVRLIYIWILLILSPIVWLMWVFPNTAKYFSQWWSKFLNWVFFAPIYMFFIYLAITATPSVFTNFTAPDPSINLNGPIKPDPTYPDFFQWQYMLGFLLVGGLLVGGLIAAQSLGVAGAGAAMGFAKTAGRKVSGYERYRRGAAIRKGKRKERAQRKAELRRVGGPTQWAREHLHPMAGGRAEARAERQAAIKKEAGRMGGMYDLERTRKIAGRRGRLRLFKHGNVEREAARAMLADPTSAAYQSAAGRQQTRVDREQRKIERLESQSKKNWVTKRRIEWAKRGKTRQEKPLYSKEERKIQEAIEEIKRQKMDTEGAGDTAKARKKLEKAGKKLAKLREREKRTSEEYHLPGKKESDEEKAQAYAYEERQKAEYKAPEEET